MRRGYRWALFCTLLCACFQTIGCGGSGTVPLTVATTSLPNGTVASVYTATLTAAGGSSPYTWTQSSGGAMPGGVSLGSSGIFAGTPTAAGTFGPYVFKVTDSTGAVASSVSLSITITAGSLQVTTTALPQGVVNEAYSLSLAASGGTPPYTWTETSGGALPPGLASVTGAGVIAGTPTTTGTFGPYVFTVTDSTNATAASQSLSFIVGAAACAPQGNEGVLTAAAPYAFLLKGTDGSGKPIDIAGSFTPNGSGGITSAALDYNGMANGPEQLQVNAAASSYAVGSSGLGCLAFAFSGAAPVASRPVHGGISPPSPHGDAVRLVNNGKAKAAVAATISGVQFALRLSGFDGTRFQTGSIIESDTAGSGITATGYLHVQTASAFALASLQPNFAFGADGWTAESAGVSRTAIAGTFTNASGALSAGFADVNLGGTASGELTGGTGTLNAAIDPTTGRGTGTFTIPIAGSTLVFDFDFYVLNGSEFILISTDSPVAPGSAPLLAGRALASNAAYPTGALNGYYLLAAQGIAAIGTTARNLAEIGTFNATTADAIPTATLYVNNAGTFTTTPYPNSTYTVEAASGRVSLTGLTATPPILYLTAANSGEGIAGFLVGSDPQATAGIIVTQTTSTPAYATSSVSGIYASNTQEDLDALNGTSVGVFSFTGTGQYLATQNSTGTVPNLPGAGTIVIATDGSGSLNSGNFPLVTNGNMIFAIPDSGDPLLYVFSAVTLP
jgi:hypothetical protein